MIFLTVLCGFLVDQLNPIQVGTVTREFYYSKKGNSTELTVYFHRTNGSPQEYLEEQWYTNSADVTVISPKSAIGPSFFEWSLVAGKQMDDVYLFDTIVASFNASTINVVGFSAGGIMTANLAFLRPLVINKVVIQSGGFIDIPDYTSSKIPDFMIYFGGDTDIVQVINFTSSTAAFIELAKYTTSNGYICKHNEGHSVTAIESLDTLHYLQGSLKNISSNCQYEQYKYSAKPVKTENKQSSDAVETILSLVILPLLFLI